MTSSTSALSAPAAAREDAAPERLESDATLLSAAGWPVTALNGVQATRQAVLQGMRTARIAHITCHGYFDTHEPLDSGLLLAPAGKRPSKMPESQSVASRLDHLLTARDIAGGALQTKVEIRITRKDGKSEFEFRLMKNPTSTGVLRELATIVSYLLKGPPQ